MRLIFLFGQVASGKLTVAKALAAKTGYALFHNHLIVDAVADVFPFGSDEFIRLREQLWLEVIQAAVERGRSIIFHLRSRAHGWRRFRRQARRAGRERR